MTSTFLITRHAIRNYGSVLQSRATELLLSQFSQVETVDYRQAGVVDTARSYAPNWSGPSAPLKNAAYYIYRQRSALRRGRLFEDFIQDELHLTRRFNSPDELRAADFREREFYCVGSDQVWNINYNVDNDPYYLDFAPEVSTRFSFASSIGMPSLPDAEAEKLRQNLQAFSGVSVREEDAADYLTSLGVEDVQHHLDPTLVLESADWRSFASDANGIAGDYLLVYQLNSNPRLESIVRVLAAELKLRPLRLEYWPNFRGRGGSKATLPSVREFVRLFSDASFVVTDSFHGTAFSSNLGVPFVSVAPPRYGSRIKSLLSLLDLESRGVSSDSEAVEVARASIDFDEVQRRLGAERDRAHAYLDAIYRRSL